MSLAVLLAGVVATAALVVISAVSYQRNETRLLGLRVDDAGALIAQSMPGIEDPLATAAQVALATHDAKRFATLMKAYVEPSGTLTTAALWKVTAGRARILAGVGTRTYLSGGSRAADRFLSEVVHTQRLGITKLNGRYGARLGVAYPTGAYGYVAYEERSLPSDGQARIASNNAFANLGYAIYLGPTATTSQLVATDEGHVPIAGSTRSVVIPFGGTSFLLVMTPTGSLEGTFAERLPWVFGVLGLLLTLIAAFLVDRLVRRRRTAELLADERDQIAGQLKRLYDEQRDIAETLQRALLPRELPEFPDFEIEARYVAGDPATDIGGDWYDVIRTGAGRFVFVVGDVCGRGLQAATVMAELRYAIRAYAAEGDAPDAILTKLSQLDGIGSGGRFATVLCGAVDCDSRTMVIANAGHLVPVLVESASASLIPTSVGAPIGVRRHNPYQSVEIGLDGAGTLLAYTDGLVERRDEVIDLRLEQLRQTSLRSDESLSQLLDRLLAEFGREGFNDDAALLGVRWVS